MTQMGEAKRNVLGKSGKWKAPKIMAAAVLAAVCIAGAGTGTAWADEDLEKITDINLTIETDISLGSYSSDVDVDTDDDEYSIGGADFINADGEWTGGTTPRLEIILYAEDGYYFGGSSKNMFSFHGTDVEYVSASREDDNTTLIVRVDLEAFDEEDLDIDNAWWQDSNGRGAWDAASDASYYQVRLYRNGAEIGSMQNVYDTYYNFGSNIVRSGEYRFEVRAAGSGSARGDWERSDTWEIDDDELSDLNSSRYSSKYDDDDDYDGSSKYDDDDDYDDYDDDDDYDDSDDDDRRRSYSDDDDSDDGPGVVSAGSRDDEDSSENGPGAEESSGSNISRASASSGSRSSSSSDSRIKNGDVRTGSGNEWKLDETGWWLMFYDGTYPFNGWQMVDGKWYCFDEIGYLRYGWILADGRWYYCGENGDMAVNTRTPDGYYVGGDGVWIP